MSAWVCPGCHGTIKSSSPAKLGKWKTNHIKSCPQAARIKETE